MHPYPLTVLVLGGMAGCIGLEILGLYLYTRQRLNIWLGLLGIFEALYCYVSFRMYSAQTLAEGAHWQFWQLIVCTLLVDSAIFLGLEYLGVLRRMHAAMLVVPTLLCVGSMWIPGFAFTDTPSVKTISWLGARYFEMELGPTPQVFFVVCLVWMAYIVFKLLRSSVRGVLQDRLVTLAYALWFVAGANDMMVSAGIYSSVYVIEFSFFLIVGLVGLVLIGAQHKGRKVAERENRQLAMEVVARGRDLASAQAELIEAAKLAAVGRLAAGVAHEVNNPLAYVMGNLQLLEPELESNPEQKELLQEALEGTRRIRTVVRQLSSFARAAPTAAAGHVEPAIDSATKMAMIELKDRARLEVSAAELPAVRMNEAQLAQVLLNLLVNAAQSIPRGHRDENLVSLRAQVQGDEVEIVVEDTGSGIPEEALPHIFEPFYTTKRIGEGQGLGLAISRELVRKGGGRIRVECVVPHGSRFVLSLPRQVEPDAPSTQVEPAAASERTAPASRAARRMRALVVDDEPLVVGMVRRMLSATFEVRTAHSGKEAIELLATVDNFDLVLCDLMMPEGSGLDVLDVVRLEHPGLVPKMVMMTGATLEHGNLEDDLAVLAKPFSVKELKEAVRAVLDHSQGSSAPAL